MMSTTTKHKFQVGLCLTMYSHLVLSALLLLFLTAESLDRFPPYSYMNALSRAQLVSTDQSRAAFVGTIQKAFFSGMKNSSLKSVTFPSTLNCTRSLLSLFFDAIRLRIRAFEQLDAFGRPEPGLLAGAINWPGSFELCLDEMYWNRVGARTKYCNLMLALRPPTNTTIVFNVHIGVNQGVCVPYECDITEVIRAVNAILPSEYLEMDKDGSYCHTSPDSLPKDGWFWTAIALAVCCFLLVAVGTALDAVIWIRWKVDMYRERHLRRLLTNQSASTALLCGSDVEDQPMSPSSSYGAFDEGTISPESESGMYRLDYMDYRADFLDRRLWLLRIVAAYSPPINAYRLWSSRSSMIFDQRGKLIEHPLLFLDGIRFITICWVLFGHCVLFSLFTANNIVFYAREHISRWTFQVVVSGTLSVDTFFLISGLLVSYTLLPKLAHVRTASSYARFWLTYLVHRIMRLSPSYFLVLILYTGLFVHAWDGPLFPQRPELLDVAYCRHHWWVTYLGNLIYADQLCMPWIWYLCNEFQYSIVLAPLFLTLVSRLPFAGLVFATCLVLSSIGTTFGLSYTNDFLPGMFSPDAFEAIYIKPYTRWGTYAIGLMLGWLLHSKYKLPAYPSFKRSVLITATGLGLASVFCLSTIYGLFGLMSGQVSELPTSVAALYNAMHRPVFALGVGIVIYLCANFYASPIRSLLGWSGFCTLSRLTYGVYLVHPIILMFLIWGGQSPVLLDDLYLVMLFFAVLSMSYIVSFCISMITESPLSTIEKLLIRY